MAWDSLISSTKTPSQVPVTAINIGKVSAIDTAVVEVCVTIEAHAIVIAAIAAIFEFCSWQCKNKNRDWKIHDVRLRQSRQLYLGNYFEFCGNFFFYGSTRQVESRPFDSAYA